MINAPNPYNTVNRSGNQGWEVYSEVVATPPTKTSPATIREGMPPRKPVTISYKVMDNMDDVLSRLPWMMIKIGLCVWIGRMIFGRRG